MGGWVLLVRLPRGCLDEDVVGVLSVGVAVAEAAAAAVESAAIAAVAVVCFGASVVGSVAVAVALCL